MNADQFEYIGPPISKERRRAAWRRIVRGLREIQDSSEVRRAAGAWQFVFALEHICDDIGKSLERDSYADALEKLKKGFDRARKKKQDEPGRIRDEAIRQERAADLRRPDRRTKKAFTLDAMKRHGVKESTVARALRGMR